MGVIRKTLSVGTFGMVSFRSKKEKLRRAERSQLRAETSLQDEHEARVTAEVRAGAAEKRARKASRRRRKKDETLGDVLAGLEPIVRKGGRRARKAAKRSARKAKAAVSAAKEAAVEQLTAPE